MKLKHRPLILIVLDGWGYSETAEANAIHHANKPVWDKLWDDYSHTLINASGTNVGLPGDQMGNSEVGHMNIGSGRVIAQDFTRINQAINDGSFFANEVLVNACQDAVSNKKSLHIFGLLSDGGVHSHQEQIFSLVNLAAQQGVDNLYLHAFLDGRDTPPQSAGTYITETNKI
jgi:2,3-bisphosphoglycerate-independent phosphoglycerate mutase